MRPATPLGIIATLLAINLLHGCAPAVVGGAATGVSVIHDRRSTGTAVEDQSIELKALRLKTQYKELTTEANLSATSYNKAVLLTGQTENERVHKFYVDEIRKIPEVKRVVDEIKTGPKASLDRAGQRCLHHIQGQDQAV